MGTRGEPDVLSKLERTLPDVTIRLATTGQTVVGSTSEESYGEVEYSYDGRSAKSHSTSHREVLPLLYGLAAMPIPTPAAGGDLPGYPLVANGWNALPWFLGVLPLLIVVAWWWTRRAPHIPLQFIEDGGQP
jgi:ABC-2 type transport system permease protein